MKADRPSLDRMLHRALKGDGTGDNGLCCQRCLQDLCVCEPPKDCGIAWPDRVTLTTPGGASLEFPGLIVGHFIVRTAREQEAVLNMDSGAVGTPDPWLVQHIPSAIVLVPFDKYEHALAYADDVSRFAAEEPSNTDPRIVCWQQLGFWVRDWTFYIYDHAFVSFRDWREGKRTAPHIRA